MNFHQPILDPANFYASELNDTETLEVLAKNTISSESSAKHILSFCEEMFDLAVKYENEKVMVLGSEAKVYDVEKVYSVFNDWVSEQALVIWSI